MLLTAQYRQFCLPWVWILTPFTISMSRNDKKYRWKFRFFKTIQHAEGQTRMLRENNVDTMAVDALTPCVISSSATRGPNQYKDVILQYRKSHCGDKTILRPSYLHYLPPILLRWHLYIESGPKVLIMQDKRALAFHQEGSQLSQECWEVNTLKARQNGCHFADDILKCIFLNENALILIEISLKFVPKGPMDNIPALVQIMAWRRPGDKPLSEPMIVR